MALFQIDLVGSSDVDKAKVEPRTRLLLESFPMTPLPSSGCQDQLHHQGCEVVNSATWLNAYQIVVPTSAQEAVLLGRGPWRCYWYCTVHSLDASLLDV